MRCFLVSHTHWDREWYRTFQAFRARLVDTVDEVLDLIAQDPGYRFLLDGQTIVLEDYVEIRPERRAALERACRDGRIGIGPWYVQPDSLLPAGETHVRNLLMGRAVGERFGPVSRVAYTPDSFGHPAQFPQLFAGFGLAPFVYWRGNADEIDTLPAEYLWEAPDGSAVLAHHLWKGYFSAAALPRDPAAAAEWLAQVGGELAARTRSGSVLLLNGIDHQFPDAHTGPVARALAARSGWTVERALLDDFAAALAGNGAPRFRGELIGGRVANLLPSVWSTRMPIKLRNRRAETRLIGWAEPWAALGHRLGVRDERAALRAAWQALLQNQAHDSICGCSLDRVHEQTHARYDAAEELATETTARVLARLAGLPPERATPWTDEIDLAVFNPSPHPRTDVVRFALDAQPWFALRTEAGARELGIHPLLVGGLTAEGFTVDGRPCRVVADEEPRVQLLPDRAPVSVEFVAADVPAFGWRRLRLGRSAAHAEVEDDGAEIAAGGVRVAAAPDGTFTVSFGERTYAGLGAIEDVGDRGDTYDFDPVDESAWSVARVEVVRRRHPSGIASLRVRRTLDVPAALAADRERRSAERVALVVETEARVAPGVDRVDLYVRVHNRARDHRLRLLFPTGAPAAECRAATTFDVTRRRTAPRDATRWMHPAPATFPQQGFVTVNGLTVVAPGLPEAEVTPAGTIAITLVRAVGWLARTDLRTRLEPAGPLIATPGAQCLETIDARLAVCADTDPRAAGDAEVELWAVPAGDAPFLVPDRSLLAVTPRAILLSALKPAEDGAGFIVRLLNPTDDAHDAVIDLGFDVTRATAVRLDETPCDQPVTCNGRRIALPVSAHALRSLRLE